MRAAPNPAKIKNLEMTFHLFFGVITNYVRGVRG